MGLQTAISRGFMLLELQIERSKISFKPRLIIAAFA